MRIVCINTWDQLTKFCTSLLYSPSELTYSASHIQSSSGEKKNSNPQTNKSIVTSSRRHTNVRFVEVKLHTPVPHIQITPRNSDVS